MAESLENKYIYNTYKAIIKTEDNLPISGTLKALTDGEGNPLPISVSEDTTQFTDRMIQQAVNIEGVGEVINSDGQWVGPAIGSTTINNTVPGIAHTGDLLETIIDSIYIPAGTVKDGNVFNLLIRTGGTKPVSATTGVRAYINNTIAIGGQTLTSSTVGISLSSIFTFAQIVRYFYVDKANGTGAGTGLYTQGTITEGTAPPSGYIQAPIDWTQDQYIVITGQLANATNSVSIVGTSFSLL